MEKILDYIKKYKYYIITAVVILICVSIIFILYLFNTKDNIDVESSEVVQNEITLEENDETPEEIKEEIITIDIKGEVNNPGVYQLPVGSRVIDAIEISGGTTKKADTSNINLSKVLNDQNVIVVDNKYNTQTIKYVEKECNCSTINDGCISDNELIESDNQEKQTTKVSINSATKEELMNLSGIGESKAIEIINYRSENGSFKTIEEIKNISGIGDKLFEKIKDQITI